MGTYVEEYAPAAEWNNDGTLDLSKPANLLPAIKARRRQPITIETTDGTAWVIARGRRLLRGVIGESLDTYRQVGVIDTQTETWGESVQYRNFQYNPISQVLGVAIKVGRGKEASGYVIQTAPITRVSRVSRTS